MAETTGIAWTDSTFNPWIGCTKVGPGCDNCYAAVSTPSRSLNIAWGPGRQRYRTAASTWKQVLRWNDHTFVQCAGCGWRGDLRHFKGATGWTMCPVCSCADWHGARRRVFCASLADVFDNEVPAEWRADLFRLIERTPHLDWLLLTKRIGNAEEMMFVARGGHLPVLPNLWLGVTVVNQPEARRDLPKLAYIPAAVRFVSYEPALGELDLFDMTVSRRGPHQLIEGLDWVIAGGESGPNARPIQRDWVDLVRQQCEQMGVAFFFKQWGGPTASAGGCQLDGVEVKQWPNDEFSGRR